MEDRTKELLKELRKIAFQNLVDRDWWNISSKDVDDEMMNILIKGKYGA